MNYLSGHGVKWVLFPSCCVLALSLSVSGLAQQLAAPTSQGAIIKGSVVDALSGRPLRGALVRLQASDSRVIITARTSDASGRFEISPVPSGRYDVWATLTGYIEGGTCSEPRWRRGHRLTCQTREPFPFRCDCGSTGSSAGKSLTMRETRPLALPSWLLRRTGRSRRCT